MTVQFPKGLILAILHIFAVLSRLSLSTTGIFWSRNLCLSVLMHLCTKFRVNQTIKRPDIAEKWFSIWRPSAMLNLQNCGTLSCDRPWKRNLRLHTKLHWNRMIPGWVIVIKPFSKWLPTAILNFRNLVFWSCVLC